MDNLWNIQLLGGLSATRGDLSVTHFETRKTALLLASLALDLSRAHPREELAERLWPDEDWEATRTRHRQAISALRRILEPPGVPQGSVLIADRSTLRLDARSVVVDACELERCLAAARESTDL